MEVRLIYVIDRRNGMSVYFRYCPGNIVDVSTLCTTTTELAQYGISIDYAIVDAGYFSEDNVRELYRNNIYFVTRLYPKRKTYTETNIWECRLYLYWCGYEQSQPAVQTNGHSSSPKAAEKYSVLA